MGFDGYLEDRLGQQVQQSSAEEHERDSCNDGATQEIDRRQHEVDHNAEVGKLKGEPYVRAACQELELTTSTLYEVQERLIDVEHRPSNRRARRLLLLDRLDERKNAMQPQLVYSRRIAVPKEHAGPLT